jgi:precorrin-2 dehydrogenase/sirohydrochlorin ferrochelatase
MSLLPIFLKLESRPCLVAGAGEIALGKIESLLEAGARVRVVSPEARPEVQSLAAQGRAEWIARGYEPADLEGAFLVIAATNQPDVNHAVFEDATQRGILCNAVDDPPFCDFYFGSVVRRGDLQVAISTAGESPALAQRLRREIDAQLPEDLGPWLENLGGLRREVLAAYPAGEERKLLLHELAHRPVCEAEQCPSRHLALDSRRTEPEPKVPA